MKLINNLQQLNIYIGVLLFGQFERQKNQIPIIIYGQFDLGNLSLEVVKVGLFYITGELIYHECSNLDLVVSYWLLVIAMSSAFLLTRTLNITI